MFFVKLVEALGRFFIVWVHELGEFLLFARSFFRWLFARPFRKSVFFRQMEFIGVRSLPIIALTGTFTGMVFALQTGYAFRQFNAQIFVGSTVGLALTREIAPVFTALMVAARAGSAMAAEIGTMKVTEQVDALSAMAVNPMHYLVVPRVVASVLMLPLLAGIFSYIGIVGAYFVAVHLLHIEPVVFTQKLIYYVDVDDVVGGLIKAAFFGAMLGLISCQRGYRTYGGAEGVGRSTTQAVVISSVVILVMDYFLTSWILEVFPGN
ncbi:MAG TPA: ABC transporter permease [bacterium]|nr:ABC transporter permease [bacterium]